MKTAPYRPSGSQVFVCVNRRRDDDPLGAGCGDRGDALYAACRKLVASNGLVSRIWITRTYCLGVCPRQGAAVALSPGGALLTEAEPSDAVAILQASLEKKAP